MIIGITGGIASGKSFVADILKECGASIIDADKVYSRLILPGMPLYTSLLNRWGPQILLPNGQLDRKRLGQIVFSKEKEREELNSLTHPLIIEALHKEMAESRSEAVLVAPLLLEAGERDLVDILWLVALDDETQVERLMKRDSLTREDAMRRVASQMPFSEKLKYADKVIDNNGPPERTREEVTRLWREVKEHSNDGAH
jgi:dephospho-CoA kinase